MIAWKFVFMAMVEASAMRPARLTMGASFAADTFEEPLTVWAEKVAFLSFPSFLPSLSFPSFLVNKCIRGTCGARKEGKGKGERKRAGWKEGRNE
jgi:hypothetical protein